MAKSFRSMSELNSSTVMIVDALNLAFRWKHSGALKFVDEYMKVVESLRRSYSAGKVIIACDMGSSSYRKAIYPEYKGNREALRATQTPEQELEFKLFFEEFMKVIEAFEESSDYPVIRYNKTEADDIAAYIVKTKSKYSIEKIVLISSDKDWDLLVVDDSILRFSYVTRKEVTLETWKEHYDWEQPEYISIKCLQGDSGDNVPGVDKVGPAKALALVRQYSSAYDVAASLPIQSKYVYIKNLNAFGTDNILRNYRLMDLIEFCEEALGEENCKDIDSILESYLND